MKPNLAPDPVVTLPWEPVAAVLLLAGAAWVAWRDRGQPRQHAWDTAGVAVLGAALFTAHLARVGPLVTHDAVRDLLWAVEMAGWRDGPSEGPRIAETPSTLGRLWYALLAVPLRWNGVDGLIAAVVASRVAVVAAIHRLVAVTVDRPTALVAAALVPLHDVVVHDLGWLTHGNGILVSIPLALLAAHRAFVEGRTAHLLPLLGWCAVGIQLHLTAVAAPLAALWLARRAPRDGSWGDTAGAIVMASVAFLPGLSVMVHAVGRDGLGALAAFSAVVPVTALAIAACRPRWALRRGLPWVAAPVAAWAAAWWFDGRPPLRLVDLVLAAAPDGPVAPPPPAADTLRRIATFLPWPGTLWPLGGAVATATLGMLGAFAMPARHAGLRTLRAGGLAAGAVALAVCAVSGPEVRYVWVVAPVVVALVARGLTALWDLPHRPRGGRVAAALLGLGAAVATGPDGDPPIHLLIAVPLLAGAVWPRAGRWTGLLSLGALAPVAVAVWTWMPYPGHLRTDASLWRDLVALPDSDATTVVPCVHGERPPWLLLPQSTLWIEALDLPPALDRACPSTWVLTLPTPHEGPAGLALPATDERAFAVWEPAALDPRHTWIDAWIDDGEARRPVHPPRLPYRTVKLGVELPPRILARHGVASSALVPGPDGVTVRASVVIRPRPHHPHELVVRGELSLRDDAGTCRVAADAPSGPLPLRAPLPHDAGTWRYGLTPDDVGVPLTVIVSDCLLEGLDMYAVSVGRHSLLEP